jgi:translation elongation factor EF-Tu-like GTPase
MKPIPEGWVVFTWSDLEDEVNSAFVEVVGIYTDQERAERIAAGLKELLGVEAWAEPAPIDTTPTLFKVGDHYEISGRGTMFTGDVIMGSSNDVVTGMILQHRTAGTLRITGVERMDNAPLGIMVSGWENWDKEHQIEGLICTINRKP